MSTQHATEAAELAPLTVDTKGLATLIGFSPSWIEKRVEERAWIDGRLPVPLEIGSRRRLWLYTAVVRWAEDIQSRAEARVRPAQEVGR